MEDKDVAQWLQGQGIPTPIHNGNGQTNGQDDGSGHGRGDADDGSSCYRRYDTDSDFDYLSSPRTFMGMDPDDGVDLDSIPVPDLTPQESCLNEEQLALRIVLKKLTILDAFGKLDMKALLGYVDHSEDYYNYEYGHEDEVLFQNGDGPDMFHLMWFKNSDKGYILNRWLTDRANTLEIPTSVRSVFRSIVVSFFPADGFWYRAIVLDILDANRVRVLFMDYGNVDVVPLNYLRILPEELKEIPPLCFSARLADINPFGDMKKMLCRETKAEFIQTMTNQKAIKARLKKYDNVKQLWEVSIWLGPAPFIDINQRLRQQIMRGTVPEKLPVDVSKADLNKMIHLTHEVNISEFREISFKGIRNYRVTHIVNPSNFSVEVMSDDDKFAPEMPWHTLMQKFYNDPVKAEQYRVRTSRVFQDRCYIWCQPSDGTWRRVRVKKVWLEVRRCQIYALDMGFFTHASFDDMFELSSQFVSHTARSCNAYLMDVAPAGADTVWSKDAIEGFANLVRGKTLHGIAITRGPMTSESSSDVIRLGLILMDKEKESKCSINAQLCLLELAEASGMGAGRRDLSKEIGEDNANDFDPQGLKEYLRSVGKDPGIVIEMNAATDHVLTGNFDDEEDRGVKWVKRPPPTFPWFRRGEEINVLIEEKMHLPTVFRRRLGICNILRVVSPSCFYIQSAAKSAELANMMVNIGAQVSETEPVDIHTLVDGEFLAVNLLDDHNKLTWHRAILKQCLARIKMIKVILVDFGAEATTRAELVRRLPEYFRGIPAYCHRVHLSPTGLRPLGLSNWVQPAKDAFRRYLRSWEEQVPVYYAFIPKGATKIPLKEFDHEVEFDHMKQKWVPSSVMHNIPSEHHLYPNRDHPMLKNLFWSIGVDIVYEIFTPTNHEYKFERIWDFLLENGFSNTAETPEFEEEDRSGNDLADPHWENPDI